MKLTRGNTVTRWNRTGNEILREKLLSSKLVTNLEEKEL
jgi:hypothetical protein